ncbi:MAG: hypothetical protein QM714_05690 [Nocardioides sp.]|uniref:hypothetical protein n=1 Tax=Nocardioides sp. TaxID=35761 RepID=UPI0039E2B287
MLAVSALAGVIGGWLWERAWTAPTGVAYQHQFVLVGSGPGDDFSGTGVYALLGIPIGLLLGLAVALIVRGHEWATLTALVIGSLLAAWLMASVGHRLGPPDPQLLAARADDLTKLTQQLRVNGSSAYLALPAGGLAGLCAGYLLLFAFQRLREASGPSTRLGDETMQ